MFVGRFNVIIYGKSIHIQHFQGLRINFSDKFIIKTQAIHPKIYFNLFYISIQQKNFSRSIHIYVGQSKTI